MIAGFIVIFGSELCLEPMYRVFDDGSYVFIVKASASLMTGLEVEYLSNASVKYATGAEYVTLLKPRGEYQLVGLRNTERLAIHLFKKLKADGKTFCDGMLRHYVPNDLRLVFSPIQITRSADYRLKGLGVMS
jgi:hypothetical protein